MNPSPSAHPTNWLVWSPGLVSAIGTYRTCVLFCAVALACCQTSSATGSPPGPATESDLASRARAILSAKCTECHAEELSRPHGKFGYVADLKRLAENPRIVVPFQPAKSKLWNLVQADEMPPADAAAGSLSAEEKEVLRTWIEAGAPAGAAPSASRLVPPTFDDSTPPRTEAQGRRWWERALRLLGKLHVLVIHFPIALLVAAVVGEIWSMWRRAAVPSPVVRFCVFLGAGGAVPAAALGWLHAAFAGSAAGPSLGVALHRWIGTAASLWAVGTCIASEREARWGSRSRVFRAMLLVGAALVGAAAHLGGTLVYGEHYFDW